MKNLRLKIFLLALPVCSVLFSGSLLADSDDSYYYKLNKSFEIYGAVFREISQNYVLDIDPEDLMNESINGMLGSLDPYTVYMNDEETDDIDLLTSGSYVGLGITVGVRDSMLTIIDIHDGYPAQKAGIKIGDRLYKIDTAVVLHKNNDDLRKYTKGNPGSKVDVWVLRPGMKDTIRLNIQREEIKVSNVSYSGLVSDSIGYIRLERFARFSAEEVRSAFNDLKFKNHIKGLILDLRDNPGGLLESAVNLCELFVPENTTIVTTKGRNPDEAKEYKSLVQPLDTNIALAVLINNYSASASEVVAGAIQDLDRGIIVGEKSFGKGLVQTVYDLPYKSNLKITTARYYTPSGRCIQKYDYNEKADHRLVTVRNGDTVFRTQNGRKVFESKGIIPDSLIENKDYPEFIIELMKDSHIFDFATEYAASHKSLSKDFRVTPEILNDFGSYLQRVHFNFKSAIARNFDTLRLLADKEKFNSKTIKEINDLEQVIKKEEKNPVNKYAENIREILEPEIYRRYFTEKETAAYSLRSDNYINAAVNLLSPVKYNRILTEDLPAETYKNH